MGTYGQGPPPPPMGSWLACHALPLLCAAQHPANASHSEPGIRMPGPLARIFHALLTSCLHSKMLLHTLPRYSPWSVVCDSPQ
jgi:hypothetical protein